MNEPTAHARHPALQDYDNWEEERALIRAGRISHAYTCSPLCRGLRCMETTIEDPHFDFSLGYLWFRLESRNVIKISNSYVQEMVRRAGLRTWMHRKMLEDFPETRMIVTARATEFSLPWLNKMGFKFNGVTDCFELDLVPPQISLIASASPEKRL